VLLNLEPDVVHVWRATSSVDVESAARLERTLSRSEHERAARYTASELRQRFAVRRGLLRWILSRYLDVAPDQVELRAAASGKPEPVAGGLLRFSAASSGACTLVAVTLGREVGVDVERIRAAAIEPVAARFFAAHEVAALRELAPPARERLFFSLWVRKEALAKATGEGLAALDTLDVPVSGCEGAYVTTASGERWSLHDVPLDEGHVAAVAASGPPFRVQALSPDADAIPPAGIDPAHAVEETAALSTELRGARLA
jgi:4'-phosphopantetheinyl transferase